MLYRIKYKNDKDDYIHFRYYTALNSTTAAEMFKSGYEHKNNTLVSSLPGGISIFKYSDSEWVPVSEPKEKCPS